MSLTKSERLQRKHDRCKSIFDLESVFSLYSLAEAAVKCKRGVAWKRDPQLFFRDLASECVGLNGEILGGCYERLDGFFFSTHERGKVRHICSARFRDRVVQKVICEKVFRPLFHSSLVETNSASRPGKGFHYAVEQFGDMLVRAYREYGESATVLQCDWSNYFGTLKVDRMLCFVREKLLEISLTDHERKQSERIITVVESCLKGDDHLDIGNQISQELAIAFPNSLDHELLEKYKYYGRYMDDSYVICENKQQAKEALELFTRLSSELGLVVNPKKTKINNITKDIVFLKTVFNLKFSNNGSPCVRRRLVNATYTRNRRKLTKMARKEGITVNDMILTIGSFVGTLNRETNYEKAYAKAEKYDLEIANLLPENEREIYKKRVHQVYEKARTKMENKTRRKAA